MEISGDILSSEILFFRTLFLIFPFIFYFCFMLDVQYEK